MPAHIAVPGSGRLPAESKRKDASMSEISKSPTGRPSRTLTRRTLLSSGTLAVAATSAGLLPAKAAEATPANSDVGAVWWSELQTADLARARAFYAAVMGWTPNVVALNDQTRPPAPGEAEYTVFKAGDREVAGAAQAEAVPDKPSAAYWLTYIQVANVDAAVLKAVELGGKLLEPAADVPNTGRIAIIEDPEGVHVGLMSPLATTSG
jgi:uncharacterized protein